MASFHSLGIVRRKPRQVLPPHDDAARRASRGYQAANFEMDILERVNIGALNILAAFTIADRFIVSSC
jgi:hypothetical protein